MSSKPLPPPPKMSSGLSPARTSSSSLRYGTPGKSLGATPGRRAPQPPSSLQKQSSSGAAPSYESFAPRTADQRARLARIAALTAGPCFAQEEKANEDEQHVTLTEAMCPPKVSSAKASNLIDGSSSAVDQAIAQTLETTQIKTNNLATLIKHTASLRLALHASLNIANDVERRHAELLRHSGELSAAAERLQHEEQVLTRRAEEIGMPLKHYDAVDRIGPLVGVLFKDGGRSIVRHIAKLHVDNVEEFVDVLTELDEAVEFFGGSGGGAEVFGRPGSANNGPGGKRGKEKLAKEQAFESTASGSAEYYRRACALQDAALELLRVAVADRISQTSTQIQDALNLPKVPMAADKLEASLVYTRFHGISKRSNALISIARKRLDALGNRSVAAASYEDLLTLCRNTYCGSRETLLTTTVRTHMDTLRDRHGLVGMTRLASVFLIRLCTVETALYLDFFGDPEKRRHPRKKGKGALSEGEEGKEAAADEEKEGEGEEGKTGPQLQRKGSSSNHPAASALASQILSEDATYRDAEFQSMLGALCSALHRTIRRGLVSVLDLDVLCQVVSVLREERSAANSSPTTLAAARAVSGVIQDAQERLIFCANNALHKEVARFKPTPDDLNYPGKLLGEAPKTPIVIGDESEKKEGEAKEEEEAKSEPMEEAPDDAVAAQLRVYEAWFPPMRSVLRILSKIFRVVEPRVFEDIALSSVQSCTKSLKDGSVHILRNSGQIHADLFLVKHLLILREQLSPFDIQLRSVERQLDFSEAGKAVTRFLANRNRRLFSMSTENALVTLLREGVSVQESSVDSKRDLEDCLRSACNDFIEHTSASLLGPIAGFVDQCKNAGSSEAVANASFMNAVGVKGVFSSALENVDGELDNVSKQMTLYLENAATQGILLKPVVRKITRALEDAKRFIGELPGDENGWDAELKAEVLNSMSEYEAKVKAASSKK
ncbi:hypothetical protein ACHAXT_000796 [Thalassiosira profunda]